MTKYEDIPDEVLDRAKIAFLDFSGSALLGSQSEIGEIILNHVRTNFSGSDTVLIGGGGASLEGAAFANGVFGHSVDFDDTFASMPIHPSSPTLPAALAAGDKVGADTRELLTAYIIGIESIYCVGLSTFPKHYYHGFHSTGTSGTFGATAAASSILNLSREQTQNAIGIAASCSSSLVKNFGTMSKPLHAGHAAEMGLRAALLADKGFTANMNIFEGEKGYGKVMAFDSYNPTEIIDKLGKVWGTKELVFKVYPVILIAQAAMHALRRLIERENLDPDEVLSIEAIFHDQADDVLSYNDPANPDQAKFSAEFLLATILREHRVSFDELTDSFIHDSETRKHMKKIKARYDSEELGEEFGRYGARVKVTTEEDQFTEEERNIPGGPENPIPKEKLIEKFSQLAGAVVDKKDIQSIQDTILSMENVTFSELRQHLSTSI